MRRRAGQLKRWLGPAALGGLLGALFTACGGNGTFPEPAPCPSPSPAPTSTRDPLTGPYRQSIFRGVQRIEQLTNDFRARWPRERPSNSSQFRIDYATYADQVTCIATDLRNLAPPAPSLEEFDSAFDHVISELIVATADGRDAVRQRNVSRYKEWYNGIEGKVAAVSRTYTLMPR